LQAKRADYVECNAKVELFGKEFVLRTFPWDRSLEGLKKHIKEQIPLLLQQRHLQIHELPDTRTLFQDESLIKEASAIDNNPFDTQDSSED